MNSDYGSQLVDSYIEWLRSKISVKAIGDSCEIETPFLDRHNDHIVVYASQPSDERFLVTDDGFTLRDLSLSGCEIDTPKRKSILTAILNGHGVTQRGEVLSVEATRADFPQKKHSLIQAILAVGDMFMVSQGHAAGFFMEDVASFFRLHEIPVNANVALLGRSGFYQTFDFIIPQSKSKPERLLKLVNYPSKSTASSLLFAFNDTRELRTSAKAIAVLNDENKKVSSDVVAALEKYSVEPLIWSRREEYLSTLKD